MHVKNAAAVEVTAVHDHSDILDEKIFADEVISQFTDLRSARLAAGRNFRLGIAW
ncbi:MAG: hypothetical protein AAAC47_24505 [Pararhizobium sp.]